MIIVTVKSKLLDKHKEDYMKEFKHIANEVRNENGCLEYELYENNPDNAEFFLFERWESKNHVEVHLKTNHMIQFIAKTERWFESKEVNIYEVK